MTEDLLRLDGVSVRLVERELEPHRQARATVIQPGTLEIFSRAGSLEPFLARSMHLDYARVFNAELEPVGEIAFAGAGCPCEFQCSLPQYRTEQILTELLTHLGGAVEHGVCATSMALTADDIAVSLER